MFYLHKERVKKYYKFRLINFIVYKILTTSMQFFEVIKNAGISKTTGINKAISKSMKDLLDFEYH